MMHADPQTVIGKEKDKTWSIEKNTLVDIRMNIRALAEQIERVNKTEFSPAKTAILCDETGDRFHRADESIFLGRSTTFLTFSDSTVENLVGS
jgi:hypothetical protein